jgi:hypothetical protein
MFRELKIADIQIGSPHRRDMGTLMSLAESIRQEGERGCPLEDCGGPWGYAD